MTTRCPVARLMRTLSTVISTMIMLPSFGRECVRPLRPYCTPKLTVGANILFLDIPPQGMLQLRQRRMAWDVPPDEHRGFRPFWPKPAQEKRMATMYDVI